MAADTAQRHPHGKKSSFGAIAIATGLGLTLFGVGCAATRSGERSYITFVGFQTPWGGRALPIERLLAQRDLIRGNQKNLETSVKIQGQIVQRSPLLNGVAYRIQDSTGSIWVYSDNPKIKLEVGQFVTVHGQPMYQEAKVDNQDFGSLYIKEERRSLASSV